MINAENIDVESVVIRPNLTQNPEHTLQNKYLYQTFLYWLTFLLLSQIAKQFLFKHLVTWWEMVKPGTEPDFRVNLMIEIMTVIFQTFYYFIILYNIATVIVLLS